MESGPVLDKTARFLSRVFHPFIISVPAGIMFLYLSEISILNSLKWILVSTCFTILPTAFFMKAHPDYHLRDINSRESRNMLYIIGLIEITVLTGVLSLMNAPRLIITLCYSLILLTSVGAIINRMTKISLHVGVLTGFSTALMFLSLPIGLSGFIITVLTSWSRLRLKRHTVQQIALGMLVPGVCISVIFQTMI